MGRASERFLVLRGGLVAELSVLRQLWALEDRGCRFTIEADGRVQISPESAVTTEEVEFLRAHHVETRQLVAYEAPPYEDEGSKA
jgi:hypothetical protein